MTERQQDVVERIREKAPGEILRIHPDSFGFLVVQQLPDDPVPVLYHVTLEEQINGVESLHWVILGAVHRSELDPSGSDE